MKIIAQAYTPYPEYGSNPGKDDIKVLIKKKRFYKIYKDGRLDNRHFLYEFEKDDRFSNVNALLKVIIGDTDRYSVYVKLNWWQMQYVLLLNNKHWFQQKDNIMWLVNISVSILAITVSYKIATSK
jgi:hypothetical protein